MGGPGFLGRRQNDFDVLIMKVILDSANRPAQRSQSPSISKPELEVREPLKED